MWEVIVLGLEIIELFLNIYLLKYSFIELVTVKIFTDKFKVHALPNQLVHATVPSLSTQNELTSKFPL